jgi:hypothetical protein
MERKRKNPAMEVQITITGKKIVFNEGTLFQATVNGKSIKVQWCTLMSQANLGFGMAESVN